MGDWNQSHQFYFKDISEYLVKTNGLRLLEYYYREV